MEWSVWVVTQAYHVTPGEAWRALGYGPLRARQLHRLTVAATELGSLDAAFDDVGRGSKDYKPSTESVLFVREVEGYHNEMMQPEWDRMAAYVAERFPDTPERGPLAMGDGGQVTGDIGAIA